MSLKGKKVLITAGPTWVPIDRVRVISNIATGETGILLAKALQRLGARVSLLLGPVESNFVSRQIRILRFTFFDELFHAVKKELKSKQVDIVVHAAAVSDFRPKIYYRKKVESGKNHWKLELVPTAKIIDFIKPYDKNVVLVGFKFLPQSSRLNLIQQAKKLMRRSDCDCVVANRIKHSVYRAWIVGDKVSGVCRSRRELIRHLVRTLSLLTLNRRDKE
jgi:phosphopantothenoylcysteine decarboxylase/phosphopantothenate--cysteine ligase